MNDVREKARDPEMSATPPASPPPPRGVSGWRVLAWIVVGSALLWVGHRHGEVFGRALGAAWRAVVSLVSSGPAEPATAAGEPGHQDEQKQRQFYTCGMHPWVILPAPGECPICHMELTPLDPAKFSGEITIDPVVVQNIGVRIAPVVKGPLVRTIRTVGVVDYDETRVRDVDTKVDGWVEKLHVDYVGASVEAGQPLFEIYSRELYSAQEEFLIALRASREQHRAPTFVARAAEDLERDLEAARMRLRFFDIDEEQIRALEQARQPRKTMTIRSPHSGVVTEKLVNEGQHVTPGKRIYRIADLSRVWVLATMYEYQLPFLKVGQEAIMTLPYLPGRVFEGTVTYIYPWVEGRTREVRVRLEFDNPDLRLRPGMFADVEVRSVLAQDRILAPRAAVIDTGTRRIAFVSLGRGRFEPRDLLLGPETDDGKVAVLDGLRPGEMVVTSGQFLLDSEAKIREALGKMIRGEMAADQQAVAARAAAAELSSLPPEMDAALTELMGAYFAIGDALAADSLEGVPGAARRIAATMDRLLAIRPAENPHFWHQHEEAAKIRGKALEIVAAQDLETVRLAFADLSVALGKLLRATGVPRGLDREVVQYHCPMYREGQGGCRWLQVEGTVRNPFYGSSMPGCFDEKKALPRAGEPEQKPREATRPGPGAAQGPAKEKPPAKADRHPQAKRPAEAKPPRAAPTEEAHGAEVGNEAGLQELVDLAFRAYLDVQRALADDRLDGVAEKFERMRSALAGVAASGDQNLAAAAAAAARAVPPAGDDLEAVRQGFQALSTAMISLAEIRTPGPQVAERLRIAHCPMKKASWLQEAEEVLNPFYGSRMLHCGSIRKTLPARKER